MTWLVAIFVAEYGVHQTRTGIHSHMHMPLSVTIPIKPLAFFTFHYSNRTPLEFQLLTPRLFFYRNPPINREIPTPPLPTLRPPPSAMASLLPLPRNHLLRHLVLSLLLLRASVASSRDAELDALMELKAALDPPGRALASWARGGDPCGGRGDYFEGVACDGRGRVATVALQGKGLTGTVPPALAMLPGLTGLYLHYNRLSGEVPRQLGQLPGLAELYLGVNNLSGRIPVELGRLRALQGAVTHASLLPRALRYLLPPPTTTL
jgi:hypothetical protein